MRICWTAFDDLVINAKGNDKRAIYCATSKDELSLCEKVCIIGAEIFCKEWFLDGGYCE